MRGGVAVACNAVNVGEFERPDVVLIGTRRGLEISSLSINGEEYVRVAPGCWERKRQPEQVKPPNPPPAAPLRGRGREGSGSP